MRKGAEAGKSLMCKEMKRDLAGPVAEFRKSSPVHQFQYEAAAFLWRTIRDCELEYFTNHDAALPATSSVEVA